MLNEIELQMPFQSHVSIDGTTDARSTTAGARRSAERYDSFDEFLWNTIAISNSAEKLNSIWAKMLGLSVHQWMMLVAIRDLDCGRGISVSGVASKLQVDPSFVTCESKKLEKIGLLKRVKSPNDARVVMMTLTNMAHSEISRAFTTYEPTKDSIFRDVEGMLEEVNLSLWSLREKLERAVKRLQAEIV
jgi:DNA-binding MarR family transcriptional regulator